MRQWIDGAPHGIFLGIEVYAFDDDFCQKSVYLFWIEGDVQMFVHTIGVVFAECAVYNFVGAEERGFLLFRARKFSYDFN